MKKLIIFLCAVAVGLGAWLLRNHGLTNRPAPRPLSGQATAALPRGRRAQTAQPPTASIPPLPSGSSEAERVAWLEKLGHVPPNATLRDRWLAQQTSWWGKRLDPKEFWKGRVLWCDKSALAEANARGRVFPPMPYVDPSLIGVTDEDYPPLSSAAEGYDIASHSSSRERIFWDYFNRTHPMPPERIESFQSSAVNHRRDNAILQGCPPEALSDEALYWARIMKLRSGYRAALALPPDQVAGMTNYVLSETSIDPNLITEPLSQEQLKAANGWKIAYLQRIHREKTDESYINAYLQAWNLSAEDVFGPTNR